jgi:transcriptional regulator with XRE-family HTH domain
MAVTTPAGEVFGERMRELRQKRGLTQVDVSERSGLPQARVSELERGARVPNLLTMIRIAVALECKFSDLASAFDKKGLRSFVAE